MVIRDRLFDPFLQHFLRFAQRQDFDGRPPQRADVHKQKKIAPKRPWHTGLWVFYPSAPSTRRATPFECQKAAKRLLRGRFAAFSCPGCWGYGIAMPEELRPAFGVVNNCGVRPHLWKRRGKRRRGRRLGEGVDPKSGNFRKESNNI